MTENLDLTIAPVPLRYCALCSKRMAAMNAGIHCFTCADRAEQRMFAMKTAPAKRVHKPATRVKVVATLVARASVESTSELHNLFASR
jgi:hypothetical protein